MRKYNTEEERKAAKKESYRKWRLSHLEQERERGKRRNRTHAAERKEYNKKYREEHKEYYQKYMQKWEKEHREERREYNRVKNLTYNKKQRATKENRARALSRDYLYTDKGRGFDTTRNIDKQWILDNILNSKCVYCGDSDWKHLGADRIDNTKPHTPDNVVCACGLCNVKRANSYSVEEFKEKKV